MRTGVEGITVVKVLIGTDGRVKQVAIVSTDDPLFADATERQALRRWRFRPATRDGIAVESWKQMTVRFELRG
ncbi:TonB family protein [Sphingomonas sp. MAH-20]|uniref:TonB family protein n=2 Tax=Sphingomonadaceae TaxID=41297 RepID=A0A6I4IXX0_9SPHN|nr:energy transducer TonB [Sphingomonas sp. CGMCC 1.13658]MVO76955.1 TonB family protein [Sphingomonas horti]